MRILVFADSHTDVDTMEMVVAAVRPDRIIHLGDHAVDAILLKRKHPGVPFDMVRGNCDQHSSEPDEKLVQIDGLTVFLAHGDAYQVDDGPEPIAAVGREAGAQIVLHGHTHIPSISVVRGVTVMNPGRIGRISSKKINASFGIIETRGGEFECEIVFVDEFYSPTTKLST